MPADTTEADAYLRALATFVGPRNQDYYLDRWVPYRRGESKRAGFNWAAFFLTTFWLGYRKMYRRAAVVYSLIIAAMLLDQVLLSSSHGDAVGGMTLLVGVVVGLYGNVWYYEHADDAVAQARHAGAAGDEADAALAERGGTSLLGSLGLFALFLAVAFAIGAVRVSVG